MKSNIDIIKQAMKAENLDDIVINTFEKYYQKVLDGENGKLTNDFIAPPKKQNLVDYNSLEDSKAEYLSKLAVIKLNGGLGTGMGLKKAKSLLPIKDGLTFLDVIAKQILLKREKSGTNIPLIFMNSFNTSEDTNKFLEKYPELKQENIPLEFLQNKFPKIKQADFSILNDFNKKLNWNPPGHGDIYMSMVISNVLKELLDNGYEYIFVSNSDNLGAVIDDKILTYFAESNTPFLMEVCNRTEIDKKGGHLAEKKNGQLVLRESAQCPDNEIAEFQNISLYSYFNTNNLWINLKALKAKMVELDSVMLLPLILNPKVVNGTPVYQLETAMGAAIEVFVGSKAMIVPRNRFAPVKKTNDILTIWSDVYDLNDDFCIVLADGIEESPVVSLDEKYYKTIEQLQERFTEVPSLKKCESLVIKGDINFGTGMKINGNVELNSRLKITLENRILEG